MPNTYTQIHLQLVFAVKYRDAVIEESWKQELYNYMKGIIENQKHKCLIINGMPDHVHILIGMRPTQSLSDLMQDIKGSSSKWINDKGFCKHKFAWQSGFGAFSYGKSQLDTIIDYIARQEEHHKKRTFLEEYKRFLDLFEIEYDEKYLFTPLE